MPELFSDEDVGLTAVSGNAGLLSDQDVGIGAGGPAESPVLAGIDAPAPEGDELATRGAILPFGRTESGEAVLALPEFLEGPRRTIVDLIEGKRQASEITGKEIFDLGFALAGPMSPAAGSGRAIARNAGRGKTQPAANAPTPRQDALQAADRIGVTVPVAAASDSSIIKGTAGALKEIPLVGQPLVQASEKALTGLESKAVEICGRIWRRRYSRRV